MLQDLIILISNISHEISENVPVGRKVSINKHKYEIVKFQSHPLCPRYLAIQGGGVIYDSPTKSWNEIIKDNGEEIRTQMKSADRADYLFFANTWLLIIRAFGVEEDKIVENLRRKFSNFWDPWDEINCEDKIDEYELVRGRCELIINDPSKSDEDKEEARATLTICEILLIEAR